MIIELNGAPKRVDMKEVCNMGVFVAKSIFTTDVWWNDQSTFTLLVLHLFYDRPII